MSVPEDSHRSVYWWRLPEHQCVTLPTATSTANAENNWPVNNTGFSLPGLPFINSLCHDSWLFSAYVYDPKTLDSAADPPGFPLQDKATDNPHLKGSNDTPKWADRLKMTKMNTTRRHSSKDLREFIQAYSVELFHNFHVYPIYWGQCRIVVSVWTLRPKVAGSLESERDTTFHQWT